MTEHTRTDGLSGQGELADQSGTEGAALAQMLERSRPRSERMTSDKIECNACPVLCQISDGRVGACDRYANQAGTLVRVDPVILLNRALARHTSLLVPFAAHAGAAALPAGADRSAQQAATAPDWDGDLLRSDAVFVTGVGASTTYPDYKPAPFIVASRARDVDMSRW